MADTDLHASEGVDEALRAGTALSDQGRHQEAIELLTRANRLVADARVEEALVALRHRAGVDRLGRPAPGALPPPVTATPGPHGPLPEVTPDELDLATLREGFAGHGCVLVRGLVDGARAEELAAGIDRALAAFDAGAAGAPKEETAPWYVPFEPIGDGYRVGGRRKWMRASGGMWTVDSPRMLFTLLELVEETGIGELVTGFFGERPALSANKCNLRRVPTTASPGWHQDGAFLGGEIRSVNLWVALTDCGTDAPGLDVVPRRFDEILPTGTEGAIFDWAVGPDVVARASEGVGVVRPQFRAGDALLFDHLLLHSTAVEEGMVRDRHALETWFFAPSAYPTGQIPILY